MFGINLKAFLRKQSRFRFTLKQEPLDVSNLILKFGLRLPLNKIDATLPLKFSEMMNLNWGCCMQRFFYKSWQISKLTLMNIMWSPHFIVIPKMFWSHVSNKLKDKKYTLKLIKVNGSLFDAPSFIIKGFQWISLSNL